MTHGRALDHPFDSWICRAVPAGALCTGLVVLCVMSGEGRPVRAAERAEAPVKEKAGADAALAAAAAEAKKALVARHGEKEAARIERGVSQVLRLWRAEDGDPAALKDFLQAEFLPQGEALDATFSRFEFALERIGGHFNSMTRDLRRGVDLDLGPMLPLDRRLAEYEPGAHFEEDAFKSHLAFVALLNFPLTTLDQRLAEGGGWSRRQWAETRLAHVFATRVPAEVTQAITGAFAEAETYINGYNVQMRNLLSAAGERPFPPGLRLISHWGLRDELKGRYADPKGLPKQRLIQKVMERIVLQEIPRAVIDNPLLDWTPATNAVSVTKEGNVAAPPGATAEPRGDREPDERYERWLAIFRAVRLADPYDPDNPTFIDRRFNVNREIPEAQVRALFESILVSPLGERVARVIEKRLGRRLEPFDIWYAGFKPRGRYEEAELDAMTRKRYPSAQAYAADMPRMFEALGFPKEKARFLADRIEVEPSRGAGHALGAARRDDKAHLRTRVGAGGMDYKGYNIAVHEMGHNVEQVFSMTTIDHTLLHGVPNNAFTEALAFVFQARDLDLLGLAGADPAAEHLKAMEEFWATREIAGVGLVDMAAWRWLYDHPEATAPQFREAVVGIARDVWNRYYASLTGARDVPLLAIYSHMINGGMYTPDYPLGHLIAFQVEQHFKKSGRLGPEFERVSRIGSLTPDAWMRQAVGAPLSAEPLLRIASEALAALESRKESRPSRGR